MVVGWFNSTLSFAILHRTKTTIMKNIIVRDDGKETNGKLVWNNSKGGWVIQGKKPKNKPSFQQRRQLFDDELIYASEVEEYNEWISPYETSRRVISHIYTSKKK